jgi:hypothetical protein
LILLLRSYQDSVRPNLPPACYALILLYALFAVATQHNAFGSFRARLAAVDELRAAGIPDASIDGGWEHDAMVQVEHCGFINNPHLPMYAEAPLSQSLAPPSSLLANCKGSLDNLVPVVVPLYTVSFDPHFGSGLSPFPPVTYRDWLGIHTVTMYIVDTATPAAAQR